MIGERDNLDPEIRNLLEEAETLTRGNEKLVLVVAFNYGARAEIARAAQRMAAAVAAGDLAVSAVTADKLASYPRCARSARSRSHHPHQRRAAAVEFPALAGGLQRARVRPDLLAGFRPLHARGRDRRIQSPRAAVRRPDRAHRFVTVADAEPTKWTGMPLPGQRTAAPGALGARCWHRSPSRSPISAAGRSRCSGDWRPPGCCGNGPRWSRARDRRAVLMGGLAPLALCGGAGGRRPAARRRHRRGDGGAVGGFTGAGRAAAVGRGRTALCRRRRAGAGGVARRYRIRLARRACSCSPSSGAPISRRISSAARSAARS